MRFYTSWVVTQLVFTSGVEPLLYHPLFLMNIVWMLVTQGGIL
jgi:hypothetical protein